MRAGVRLLDLTLVVWIAVGCTGAAVATPAVPATPTAEPPATAAASPTPTARPALGAPLDAPPRPDPATCDRLQRDDRRAARNIRGGDLRGIGFADTETAVEDAATDPAADIQTLGIPLRPDELGAIRTSGMWIDAATPMQFWVTDGRSDLFGGIWVNPPGTQRYVVSIVGGDRDALLLARCLERDGLDVRYVMATYSKLELDALKDRILADREGLEADGIRLVSIGGRASANRVSVDVEGLTPDMERILIDRYGEMLDVVGVPIPVPPAPLELPDVPLTMAPSVLFDELHNDGRQGVNGRWELLEGQLTDRGLRLRMIIEPPRHGLPVRSGPAVLFTGMKVFGGSGDMGDGEPIDALGMVELGACDDANCRYEVAFDMPLDEVIPAVRMLEARANVSWLEVNLTLVRTFGGGSWLQVLPFSVGGDGLDSGRAGVLGRVQPVAGLIFPFGLFPAEQAVPVRAGMGTFTTDFDYPRAVERARVRIGDASRPVDMIAGTLRAEFAPACAFAKITMHTDAGDRVFQAAVQGNREIDGSFAIPPGTTWRLTVHDGGGIDFDQGRMGAGIRAGEIRTNGNPIDVNASFSCPQMTGSVAVAERP